MTDPESWVPRKRCHAPFPHPALVAGRRARGRRFRGPKRHDRAEQESQSAQQDWRAVAILAQCTCAGSWRCGYADSGFTDPRGVRSGCALGNRFRQMRELVRYGHRSTVSSRLHDSMALGCWVCAHHSRFPPLQQPTGQPFLVQNICTDFKPRPWGPDSSSTTTIPTYLSRPCS